MDTTADENASPVPDVLPSAEVTVATSEAENDGPAVESAAESEKDAEASEAVEAAAKSPTQTIADRFGYHFNADGKLRNIDDDTKFKFTTQKMYEDLGDVIGEAVYEMMEKETGLERRWVERDGKRRFYFVSPDYETKERILVLIHGSGVVKAGQWARKLIMNESLDRGTQLPYIRRALANNWGVVVLNYNEKCEGEEKRGCHYSDDHGAVEWAHALNKKARDAQILVVAHSAGGDVASNGVRKMRAAGDERVLLVALTDSWFTEGDQVPAVNFNTMKSMSLFKRNGTWQMYSGDGTHEGTSAACIDAAFAVMEGVQPGMDEKEFYKLLRASEQLVFDQVKGREEKKKDEEKEQTEEDEKEGEKGEEKKEDTKEEKKQEEKKEGEEKKETVEKKEDTEMETSQTENNEN